MRYDGMLYGYVLRKKKKVTMRATTRIYLLEILFGRETFRDLNGKRSAVLF